MCSVDIPETPEIQPLISVDPNAGKAANVKTGAGVKDTSGQKTGAQQLRSKPPGQKGSGFFDILSGLVGGAQGGQASGLQIPQV